MCWTTLGRTLPPWQSRSDSLSALSSFFSRCSSFFIVKDEMLWFHRKLHTKWLFFTWMGMGGGLYCHVGETQFKSNVEGGFWHTLGTWIKTRPPFFTKLFLSDLMLKSGQYYRWWNIMQIQHITVESPQLLDEAITCLSSSTESWRGQNKGCYSGLSVSPFVFI